MIPRCLATGLLLLAGTSAALANEPPVAVDDAWETTSDRSISIDAPGVLANDSDPDGDDLVAVLVTGPLPGSEFDLFADGGFEYKPPPGFSGTDSFTYQADDGAVLSSPATVVLTVAAGSGGGGFTDEALFLAQVEALGLRTVQEEFEDDAVWGDVRSTISGGFHTAPSVTSQGLTWTSNHPENEITTGDGAARRGLWGFYSLPHGNFTAGVDCHLPGNCGDGWILVSDEPMYAGGGWVRTNTPFASLNVFLDGDPSQPIDFGNTIVDTQYRFFGVIEPNGFHSLEFREMEGTAEDAKFLFSDDFTVGLGPSQGLVLSVTGSCPGSLTLSVTGGTPNQRIKIWAARRQGTFVVPSGPCAGTVLDLDAPRSLAGVLTDANGDGSIVRNVGGSQCGLFLQALDNAACAVSGVTPIP